MFVYLCGDTADTYVHAFENVVVGSNSWYETSDHPFRSQAGRVAMSPASKAALSAMTPLLAAVSFSRLHIASNIPRSFISCIFCSC